MVLTNTFDWLTKRFLACDLPVELMGVCNYVGAEMLLLRIYRRHTKCYNIITDDKYKCVGLYCKAASVIGTLLGNN